MLSKVILVLALALVSTSAFALDPQKCFKVVTANGLIKYDFPGYSSSEYMTKKYGSSGGISQYSSQSSTSSIDPMVSTGRFVSTTQFSSSDGGCSYFSYNRERRRDYFERNGEAILEQVSLGRGEHLRSIYYYSACRDGGLSAFQALLQTRFDRIQGAGNSEAMLNEVESVVRSDASLRALCDLG